MPSCIIVFNKKYRLKKAADIGHALKEGGTVKVNRLLLRYISNDLGHVRVAVSFAKKLKLSGAKRVMLRRKLIAAIKDSLNEELKENLNFDCFFILLAIPDDNIYQELHADTNNLIQKLNGRR